MMSTEPCQKCKHWEKLRNTGWNQSICHKTNIIEPEENNDQLCYGFKSNPD